MATLLTKFKIWKGRKKIKRAVYILRNLETMMKDSGVPRNERRAVWRCVAGSDKERAKVIKKIAMLGGEKPDKPKPRLNPRKRPMWEVCLHDENSGIIEVTVDNKTEKRVVFVSHGELQILSRGRR